MVGRARGEAGLRDRSLGLEISRLTAIASKTQLEQCALANTYLLTRVRFNFGLWSNRERGGAMVKPGKFVMIGQGTYSLADAQRITGVPSDTIRRWTRGYEYRYKKQTRYSPPIIGTKTPEVDGTPTLNFADLMEVRFLNVFRKYGVSARIIRIASRRAQELLGRPRPFSTKIFKTDGRTILADFVHETGDRQLLELVQDQYEFTKVVDPFLYHGIEFNDMQEPERWWPLGSDREVVIDPARAFGAPIAAASGIPTRVLAAGVDAEQSVDLVARWYRVTPEQVNDAVEFEQSISA